MHELEPWQVTTLMTMFEKKQALEQRAVKQIAPLDEALQRQIDAYAKAAGLEGEWGVTNQGQTFVLVPLEELTNGEPANAGPADAGPAAD